MKKNSEHGTCSGEEVSFSLRYSRITDRLTPPIRASKKKHHAKPSGFPSRVGTRNQNSPQKRGEPKNADRSKFYVKPEGTNL